MYFGNDFSREYVGSGSFIVKKSQPKILEAILGTCVAVTLCDHAAGVGGMIHLLLWEPFGDGALTSPASYASTGLPLLIQAMIDAGAKKDRMVAGIAGGALVGPVSMTDRNLDVGGRTADTVDKILWLEGIPVEVSETGGYEGRRALLNLQSFETRIEPSLKMSGRGVTDFTKPSPEAIQETIKGIRPIPQIALKIIRMLGEGDYGWLEVSEEVRRDQVILGKVLHLCNVASLGLRTKVDSIERGVILLGENKLAQIVMSTAFEDYYSQAEQGYSLTRGGLYRHAVGTAMLAERLALFTNFAQPDMAYTAGLLHDIGMVVLDQYMANVDPFFYRQKEVEEPDLIKIEQETLGVDHTEVGARLAEIWGLSETMKEVISKHHYPEKAGGDPKLTMLVYLADLLMSKFQAGLDLGLTSSDRFASGLARLGIKSSQFPEIVNLIPRTII